MGLALDEPKKDDEEVWKDGVCFLLGQEIRGWLHANRQLNVEYNRIWRSFSVYIGGMRPC